MILICISKSLVQLQYYISSTYIILISLIVQSQYYISSGKDLIFHMNIATIQDLKYTISTLKDINIIYADGHTLLTRFTEYGDIDFILLLLENKA